MIAYIERHDMKKLQDRVAIVTGSGQGIGKAIAGELAQAGAVVAVWDIDGEVAEATAAEFRAIGHQARAYVGDVGSSAAVDGMFAQVEKDLGPVAILVNNAGITRLAMITKMSDAEWDDVIRINLSSYFFTTRAAARSMKEHKRGAMVNISSLAAQRGSIGQINYASAKAGILGLTRSASRELARYGIRANAITPGVIETRMTTTILTDDRFRAPTLAEIPLGRVGQPEDIARTACFLVSDDADFITGQVIGVNGGQFPG